MVTKSVQTLQEFPLLLTGEQVCGELAISRVTLWRLVKAGDIKSVRLGRRCIRFSRDELRAYLVSSIEAKKANQTSERGRR